MGIFKSDEDEMPESTKREGPRTEPLPLLPLRDIVVFPYMVVPLFVGRAKSIHAPSEKR